MADSNVEELCKRIGLAPGFFALCDKGANCITARYLAKLDESDKEDIECLTKYGIDPFFTRILIRESREIMENGRYF